MTVTVVSLAPARARPAAPPALAATGADVILGARLHELAQPIRPAADMLFGPRGAAVMADGALWVADTGHHRLLGWATVPAQDHVPADWVIGQPHFAHEGRN